MTTRRHDIGSTRHTRSHQPNSHHIPADLTLLRPSGKAARGFFVGEPVQSGAEQPTPLATSLSIRMALPVGNLLCKYVRHLRVHRTIYRSRSKSQIYLQPLPAAGRYPSLEVYAGKNSLSASNHLGPNPRADKPPPWQNTPDDSLAIGDQDQA